MRRVREQLQRERRGALSKLSRPCTDGASPIPCKARMMEHYTLENTARCSWAQSLSIIQPLHQRFFFFVVNSVTVILSHLFWRARRRDFLHNCKHPTTHAHASLDLTPLTAHDSNQSRWGDGSRANGYMASRCPTVLLAAHLLNQVAVSAELPSSTNQSLQRIQKER